MRRYIIRSIANAARVQSGRQKALLYLDITVSRATAPAARLTAYEAVLHSGLGACAEEQGGKGSCEPAPQHGVLSVRGEAPPCQPTSAHSTQLAIIYFIVWWSCM